MALVLGLAACGGGSSPSATTGTPTAPSTTPSTPPPPPTQTTCTAVVTGVPPTVTGAGGRYPLTIGIGSGCGWTAQSDAAWATFSQPSGQGPGSSVLTVDENVDVADSRAATLTIAGQVFRFSQANGCIYTFDRTSAIVSSGETSAEIRLTTRERCNWTSRTSETWLSVDPSSGSGSAVLRIVAAQNTGGVRTAFATIANVRVQITQEAR